MSFLSIHPKKGRMMMIQIKTKSGKAVGMYKDYEELFEHIVEQENLKLLDKKPDFQDMYWSFMIYPPRQVPSIYTYRRSSCDAVREAFMEGLPLIEICTGDFENPRYIAMTPNTDLPYLKKQWCQDYCSNSR